MSNLAINLSNREDFEGGSVYREVIHPDVAEFFGALALSMDQDPNDVCFYEPIFRRYRNSPYLAQPNRRKAWIKNPHTKGSVNKSIKELQYYATPDQRPGVMAFSALSCVLDTATTITSESAIQFYKKRGLLMPHTDSGVSSRHLTLSGKGQYRTHDQHDNRIEEIDVSPGDMVWTDDCTVHSFYATEARSVLSSIDAIARGPIVQ